MPDLSFERIAIVKSAGTYSMYTDHSYYGDPIETSTVCLSVDEHLDRRLVQELQHLASERLHSMVKRMPHRYWRER